jgi:hypothetical protein
MRPNLKRTDYLLCSTSEPGSRSAGIIGQPFVVPDGVTKLTELGLGVGTGSGGGATSFTAEVSIARISGRSLNDLKVLSTERATINGDDWTSKLSPKAQVAVTAGEKLFITVIILRTVGDASTAALALVPEGQPGVANALASNSCAPPTTNRAIDTVSGSLAVRVIGR